MVTRIPSPVLLEPGAPPWAQRFALRVQSYFKPVYPIQPTQQWSIVKADLPPAKDWAGAVVYLNDLKKLAISDGTAWRDAMGGAV
jgi:hypothetical protein